MTWTMEMPTKPGWYWWRYSNGRKPIVLYITKEHISGNDVFTQGSLVMFLEEVPGEWSSSPIEEPKGGEMDAELSVRTP